MAAIVMAVVTSAHAQLDLTTAGATTNWNGAIFTQIDPQSTGTGVIDPFLRVQANGTEQGWNSSVSQGNLPNDEKAGIWTHDLQLSALGVFNVSGINYYKFVVDINQNGASPLLSLDVFKIYTRPTNYTDANAPLPTEPNTGGSVLRFDMDGSPQGDNYLKMDYSLNPGSGAGDVEVFVPVSNFSGAASTDYLYLFTRFGDHNASNDGFEEWYVVIPEPGTFTLVGLALASAMALLRRRR